MHDLTEYKSPVDEILEERSRRLMCQAMIVVGATSLSGVITVLFFIMDFIDIIHVTDLSLDLL